MVHVTCSHFSIQHIQRNTHEITAALALIQQPLKGWQPMAEDSQPPMAQGTNRDLWGVKKLW